ncbi:hypothetical protein Desaci_4672 [Desulfosporosinus acidiphilus SJ4]|uniref:Uncharacterized protein n=1 Tax=Desulfosporosinus acidiphilus (strain DSM 22704 / JCM 16185 / SJ4) TaxID=646529 RepID=I4DCI2_DESAJ|nr:hypothetical protein Desaci_4672 [Desulfosporosinus acidiphilus SJ4]
MLPMTFCISIEVFFILQNCTKYSILGNIKEVVLWVLALIICALVFFLILKGVFSPKAPDSDTKRREANERRKSIR